MSIELKPCPFCGGSDFEIVENGRIWSGMKYSEPVSVGVRHWCPATPGQPSRMIERVGRDEASAVTAWNTRHTLSQQPAIPEGWVPCIVTYEGQHPEEVAYGPQRMMERLKKWLDRYFEMKVVQQPATGEPVAWPLRAQVWKRESTQEWVLEIAGTLGDTDMNIRHTQPLSVAYENVPGLPAFYTHPAPSAPKDDQIAALVNKVRDIARMFHDHQSLRERIAIELAPALNASQEVKSNAERWRYAIADGENQSMNFLDIFNGWDGDGDFVEVFDAAMLAANEGSK